MAILQRMAWKITVCIVNMLVDCIRKIVPNATPACKMIKDFFNRFLV